MGTIQLLISLTLRSVARKYRKNYSYTTIAGMKFKKTQCVQGLTHVIFRLERMEQGCLRNRITTDILFVLTAVLLLYVIHLFPLTSIQLVTSDFQEIASADSAVAYLINKPPHLSQVLPDLKHGVKTRPAHLSARRTNANFKKGQRAHRPEEGNTLGRLTAVNAP